MAERFHSNNTAVPTERGIDFGVCTPTKFAFARDRASRSGSSTSLIIRMTNNKNDSVVLCLQARVHTLFMNGWSCDGDRWRRTGCGSGRFGKMVEQSGDRGLELRALRLLPPQRHSSARVSRTARTAHHLHQVSEPILTERRHVISTIRGEQPRSSSIVTDPSRCWSNVVP